MPSIIPYVAVSLHPLSFISGCGLSISLPKSAISNSSLTTPLCLKTNSYYRHKETAKTCAHFVTHLFVYPNLPSPSITNPSILFSTLAMLIVHPSLYLPLYLCDLFMLVNAIFNAKK